MGRISACGLAAFLAGLLLTGMALAQTGGQAPPGAPVPKQAVPEGAATEPPKPPAAKVAGNFGQWALVCNEPKTKEEKPACSLVQALVERDSKKLVFRLAVAYGPQAISC